ncbi:2,3-bisphosphoglycerate-independent phosphoglycerate mutase [Candidatus Dojkabacteria bacterium HGW-Dojkabacteria-1]|uniref:2,3-bisphosphoglycerate-independent phosphoglycerate mutase n=1 Tax=Candidatus Dojkabacteria bacterium HGW-Dojkabacteria-1 TaxID=2013761 RepID=A0A2N2F3H2_9BACT|nr:MAG: 2,3-bisphosphoglycerate-independent phosphoglycerate mutase [Candidatus Dojkabacteria bacterium HGW-Dojkabacteria-1]
MFGLFNKKEQQNLNGFLAIDGKEFVTLVILDGFGIHPDPEGNSVLAAKTPFLDLAWSKSRSTLIHASGTYVGLPGEEDGNSEVGHLNLGAGQVVYQTLPRINDAISTHELDKNDVLKETFSQVRKRNSNLHLVGVLSAAGVHGHIKHLFSLMELAKANGVNPYIHVMLDGRDTPPKDGFLYLNKLNEKIAELGVGRIASMQGRFYGMDRDNRWERIKLAYDAMVGLSQETFQDPIVAIQNAYAKNETDQFFKPRTRVDAAGKPVGPIRQNDVVIYWNFREDRARELTKAFVLRDFNHFVRRDFPENLYFATMTGYEEGIPAHVIFPPKKIKKSLASYLADNNMNQLHVSETEKNMHVTYFFNGGIEAPHKGEQNINIPSPRVDNYAMVPAMSAELIRDEVLNNIKNIKSNGYKFILINFANPDMLGHTGDFKAAVMGNEIVDNLTAQIAKATLELGGAAIITADHGNCETMVNRVTKEIDIAHTNNPVPMIIMTDKEEMVPTQGMNILKVGTGPNAKSTGLLADVAPTCLGLLGLEVPDSMTGVDLRTVL